MNKAPNLLGGNLEIPAPTARDIRGTHPALRDACGFHADSPALAQLRRDRPA